MDNTIRKIRKWATIGVLFVPLRPIYTWENLFEVFFSSLCGQVFGCITVNILPDRYS